MTYRVKLEIFEGPLDLLIHLIEKNEMDIYDIPVARITEQYLEYLETLQELDLEMAGEFLVMAATLLAIKAKMLLPKPPQPEEPEEEGPDPREELVERLLEYKKFKEAAGFLEKRGEIYSKMFTRPVDEEAIVAAFAGSNPLEGVTPKDLLEAFRRVLNRVSEKEEKVNRIPRPQVTIRDKMTEILEQVGKQTQGVSFTELFKGKVTRLEIIVTFLALLELIRLKRVTARQSSVFGEIIIYQYPRHE
ncbi:segregation and condensation protein A [Calderihabitans maritimus]|uniref:Segregation and condensation protein A n=1 Tax=Calderihabitans maritimus TaxID=1246530 RepID=A0A1Z5HX53_9FIRM|nr:segregation/condensation protein A [Calderihabitans maritimus]GAW93911.1 chromosome segregation and condensation protein ScpA [Calderihabitans maritimus]